MLFTFGICYLGNLSIEKSEWDRKERKKYQRQYILTTTDICLSKEYNCFQKQLAYLCMKKHFSPPKKISLTTYLPLAIYIQHK